MIDVKVEDSGLNINVSIEGSGPPGKPGSDGVSPTVDVTETENGHKVTITDKDGAKSFEITNGRDGTDGTDGKSPYVGENGHWFEWQDGEYVDTEKVAEGRNGDDGVSPTVEVTQTGTGHKVVITDKDGEKSFDVSNGQNGEDGEDGVSPTIAVEDVEGGHKVIITGKDGPKEFVVLDGKNGDPGDPGENGQTPSITIGTVETLPADSPATAEITGETPNLTLNMGIPKGKDGTKGDLPDSTDIPDDYVLKTSGGFPVWGELASIGGEKWELLVEYTVTEEEEMEPPVAWVFGEDMEKNPISVSKIAFFADAQVTETGKALILMASPSVSYNVNYLFNKTLMYDGKIFFMAAGGNIDGNQYAMGFVSNNPQYYTVSPSIAWCFSPHGNNGVRWPFEGMRIQPDGANFKAGTKFEIWGVKA